MENEENTENDAKSHQSHPNCIMLQTVMTKINLSASRMYLNHSSRNGMRMQLAWWDSVDTRTYLRSKGKI